MSGEIEIRPVDIRRARPGDEARALELIFGSPSREAAGIAGGDQRAFALGRGLFEAGVARTAQDDLVLAFRKSPAPARSAAGTEAAGGALLGRPAGEGTSSGGVETRMLLRAAAVVLRLYKPWELPAFLRRVRMRGRLDFPVPPGSYHVVELHVDPQQRGTGLGSALLEHAEARARQLGRQRINLTTAIGNPAQGLYARHGYMEVARRTTPGYEELTGSPGRVFLEKRL
jgi:ribosomal protein S18 acetylase RimI-like enzyme